MPHGFDVLDVSRPADLKGWPAYKAPVTGGYKSRRVNHGQELSLLMHANGSTLNVQIFREDCSLVDVY